MQSIDWSGIKTAAVALNSVRDAAMRAAIALPEPEKTRFIERVNKRAYRERWLDGVPKKEIPVVHTVIPKSVQRDKLLAASVQTGAEILDGTTLSRLEKRQFLAKIVRTPLAEIDASSPLCAEDVKTSVQTKSGDVQTTRKIKAHDKLRALEIDAKMQGELKENGVPAITLNLGFFGS